MSSLWAEGERRQAEGEGDGGEGTLGFVDASGWPILLIFKINFTSLGLR